ncbi:MAG TPA: DUF6152 family protein [Steroidobacteraceae bacterium]|jgi:hypothetical protein
MRLSLLVCVVLVALSAPLPAPAHHSTANFDMTKKVALTGTVTYFAFTNPHSYFDMEVSDKKGAIQHYKVFTVARVVMTRNGWVTGDLNAGDKVTVVGNPDRKQPNYMYLQKITFKSGKEWLRDKIF